MDIQAITGQITSFATKIYQTGKAGVCWCGHLVKAGYSRFVIPAAEKISAVAVVLFNLIQKMMKTGPGVVFALAAGLLLAGITAFKFADRKAYEDDSLTKTAWKTAGIAAFVGATAMTSLGILTVLTL